MTAVDLPLLDPPLQEGEEIIPRVHTEARAREEAEGEYPEGDTRTDGSGHSGTKGVVAGTCSAGDAPDASDAADAPGGRCCGAVRGVPPVRASVPYQVRLDTGCDVARHVHMSLARRQHIYIYVYPTATATAWGPQGPPPPAGDIGRGGLD